MELLKIKQPNSTLAVRVGLRRDAGCVSLVPSAAAKPVGPGGWGQPELGHLSVPGSAWCLWSSHKPVCQLGQPLVVSLQKEEPLFSGTPAFLGSHCVRGWEDHHKCTCENSCSIGGKPLSNLWTVSEPASPVLYPELLSSGHLYHQKYRGPLSQGQGGPHHCWALKGFNTHHAPCTGRIGFWESNGRAKSIPGCLCL